MDAVLLDVIAVGHSLGLEADPDDGDHRRLSARRGPCLDSLDLVGVLMKLEDHFDLKIELDDVPNIETVAELAAHLERFVATTHRPPDLTPPSRAIGWPAPSKAGPDHTGATAMERRGLNIRKVLLGIVLPVLRRLPPRVASNMVAGIGRTEYALLKGLRHRVDQAVLQGSHHFGRSWNVQRGRPRARGQPDPLADPRPLLDGLPDDRVAPLFSVSGRDRLDAALAEKRGVILLCNHFGSHMMPAHWLFREGYPLRLFMERPGTSRSSSRASSTPTARPASESCSSRGRRRPRRRPSSILRASRVLKAGMILMIAGDVRWSGPQTSPAHFLGRRLHVLEHLGQARRDDRRPGRPGLLPDRRRRAPITSTSSRPTRSRAGHRPRSRSAGWVQAFLQTIEDQVERYPANSNEYFFWSEVDAGSQGPLTPRRERRDAPAVIDLAEDRRPSGNARLARIRPRGTRPCVALWPWLLLAVMTLPAVWHVLDFPEDLDDEFPAVVRPTLQPPSSPRLPPGRARRHDRPDRHLRLVAGDRARRSSGLWRTSRAPASLAGGARPLARGVLVRREPRADVRRLARARLAATC